MSQSEIIFIGLLVSMLSTNAVILGLLLNMRYWMKIFMKVVEECPIYRQILTESKVDLQRDLREIKPVSGSPPRWSG